MKKSVKKGLLKSYSLKVNLAMKLTVLLLVVSILSVQANGYGQKTKVTIDLEHVEMRKVLETIESLTDFKFLYNNKKIDAAKLVSIKVVNEPISEVLDDLFEGTSIYYVLRKKQIVLKVNPTPVEAILFNENSVLNVENSLQKLISGAITDAQGVPLSGANIVEKGTTNGVTADFDGNFSIEVADDDAILVVSYLGFATKEVPVGGQTTINVMMDESASSLGEVVLIGYGSTGKKEITSAVTVIDEKEFNKGAINDPTQLLQGKVAGLSIYNKGGDPNSGTIIRLRGISTVGANSEPLVVIDGVVGASLDNVDPNDIASMNVLKDGSAAAIYGTRGSSGVILVTTKKGETGDVKIEYSGQTAISSVDKTVDVMNADEFIASGGIDLGNKNDWVDLVTRTAASSIHNISVSGGQKNTTYRFSGNYRNIEGIVLNSGFDQFNTRANISTRALNDKLKIDFNTSYTKRNSKFSYGDILKNAITYNPTAPVYGKDAPFKFNSEQYGGYFETLGLFDSFNPVGIVNQNTNIGERSQFNYDFSFKYNLTNDLDLIATYGSQNTNNTNKQYNPITDLRFGSASSPVRKGRAVIFADESDFKLFEMYSTWKTSINKFDVTLTGGYSFQENQYTSYRFELGDFPDDKLNYINAIQYSQDLQNKGLVQAQSYASPNERIIAFFGRVNMIFDQAIFLNASLRKEGSSKLGEDNRWGLFPSFGIGADLNKYLDLNNVDILKARFGYGITGALPKENGLSQEIRTISYDPNTGAASSTLLRAANPDLQWEEKAEMNLGFDFNTGRLTSTLDLYSRDISNFILDRKVETSEYGVDRRVENVGKLNTKGIELAVNYDLIKKDKILYNTGIIFSTYKTTLKEYVQDQELRGNLGSGQNGTYMVLVKEGQEIGQIWGPVYSGEVDSNGSPIFVDINNDGELVTAQGKALEENADFAVLGNGIPDYEIGWTNQLSFGKWDVNVFFRGAFGHSLVNTFRAFFEPVVSNQGSYNFVNTKYADPAIRSARFSSLYVEEADFVKLDNLSIGYSFGSLNNSFLKAIRLSLNAQNLFTITNYTGSDPEPALFDPASNDDVLAPGIDRRTNYFSSRTVTIGLNINL